MRGASLSILLLIAMFLLLPAAAQSPAVSSPNGPQGGGPDFRLFEAASALSSSLISWATVMFGGSILAVLSTSYQRPASLVVRFAYFCFIPAWVFLARSIYFGTRLESIKVAALFAKTPNMENLKESLNSDALSQLTNMEYGLSCFALWLIVYLSWWVFSKKGSEGKPI
jgi:hypothetical protein